MMNLYQNRGGTPEEFVQVNITRTAGDVGDTRGVRPGKYYQNSWGGGDTRGVRPGKFYQNSRGGGDTRGVLQYQRY